MKKRKKKKKRKKEEKKEKKEENSISLALSQAFSRNVQFGGRLRLFDVAKGATFVFFSSGGSRFSVKEWVKVMEKVSSFFFFFHFSSFFFFISHHFF